LIRGGRALGDYCGADVQVVSGTSYVLQNLLRGRSCSAKKSREAFNATLKASAGSGVLLAQGKRALLIADGTDVVRVTPDT